MKKCFLFLILFLIPLMTLSAFGIRIGPDYHRGYRYRRYYRYPGRYYRRGYVYRGGYYYGSDTYIESGDNLLGKSRIWDTDAERGSTVVKLENGMIFRVYVPNDNLRGYWARIFQSGSGYKLVIDGRALYAERLD